MAISIAILVVLAVGFAIYSKGANRKPSEPRKGPRGVHPDPDDR